METPQQCPRMLLIRTPLKEPVASEDEQLLWPRLRYPSSCNLPSNIRKEPSNGIFASTNRTATRAPVRGRTDQGLIKELCQIVCLKRSQKSEPPGRTSTLVFHPKLRKVCHPSFCQVLCSAGLCQHIEAAQTCEILYPERRI